MLVFFVKSEPDLEVMTGQQKLEMKIYHASQGNQFEPKEPKNESGTNMIYKYINVCIYKYNYICSTLCSFSRRWNIPNFPPNFISLTPFHPTPPPPSHHHINNVSVADIHTQSHILSEWYGRLVKSLTSSGNPFFREPSWEELQTSHFELPTVKMERIIWDEQHKLLKWTLPQQLYGRHQNFVGT